MSLVDDVRLASIARLARLFVMITKENSPTQFIKDEFKQRYSPVFPSHLGTHPLRRFLDPQIPT